MTDKTELKRLADVVHSPTGQGVRRMNDFRDLKSIAESCQQHQPLRFMRSHGALYIRNDNGIVFDVHQNRSFPEFMAQNKDYADLVLAATPEAILALFAENERIKARLCVCRDCGGQGEVYSGHSTYQGHYQPPEPDMDVCGTCGGDGVLGPVEDFEALAAERDQLKAAIATPESVFINLKAGKIPKPSLRSMIDLYGEVVNGEDAQLLEIAKLRAENEALRKDRTDWQAECLKRGFKYVREPDDHYVLADVPEMADLLGALLGVEVRSKENDSYEEANSQLSEQIEGLVNTIHSLESLRKDAERYRWLRNPSDGVVVRDLQSHLRGDHMDKRIDAAMGKGEQP